MFQFQTSQDREKLKKINQTLSDDSQQSNPPKKLYQNTFQNPNIKPTSHKKIGQYLNFITSLSSQNESFTDPRSFQGYQKTQLPEIFELFQKENSQEPSNQNKKESENFLNQITLKFLSQYQSFHHQKLQQKILKSGRFKKVDSFTSQLLIYDIHPSKHYEIVKIGVQLLTYRTQILILNSLSKSPLPQMAVISGSGGFGSIYFIRTMQDQLAIKSISISETNKSNPDYTNLISSLLIQSIREFFWLLLFSELQIGPKAKTICGFDIILYEDSIQFATEICEVMKKQMKNYCQQVSKTLFDMHMLQAIHKDVKPSNILFSPNLNKHVLIDFGCTVGIKQTLGKMTMTKFTGTTAFCSKQMLALLSKKKRDFVDLYSNDFFGLKKTLQVESKNFKYQKRKIAKPKVSHFLQLRMKFYLYQSNFENFMELWSIVTRDYSDQIQEIETDMLRFLPELKITSDIKHFYWTQISESIRDLPELKEINNFMVNQHQLFAQFSISKSKQLLFSLVEQIYKTFQVKSQNNDRQESQLNFILMNEKSILQFLESCQQKLKGMQKSMLIENQKLLAKIFLAISLFSSLASNQYTSNLQKKIRACEIGLQLIYLKYGKEKENEILFQTSIQFIMPIVKFYQLFLLNMWSKVSDRYKLISLINSITSLYLLGYPSVMQNINFYLTRLVILSAKQNLIYGSEKSRILALRIFWQCKLVNLIFSEMFYNVSRLKVTTKKVSQDNIALFDQMDTKLFYHQSESQISIVFEINNEIYKQIILNHINFNQLAYQKIISLLNIPKLLQLQKIHSDIRKWRTLMRLVLYSFGWINHIQSAGQNLNKLNQQNLFQHQYKQNIIPYIICLFFQNSLQIKTIYELYSLIDKIINIPQISFRIAPHKRIENALLKKDFTTINLMKQLIQNEINTHQFNISENPLINCILLKVSIFVQQYLAELPKFTSQSKRLLGQCFLIIKQMIKIGYRHYDSHNVHLYLKKFDQSSINIVFIQNVFNKGKLIRNFFIQLLKISQTYFKLSRFFRNEIQQYQNIQDSVLLKETQNFWSQIQPQHEVFLNEIAQNKSILSFLNIWFRLIEKFPSIKNIIKSNRNLLVVFFGMHQCQRQTLSQIYKTIQIFQDFFDFRQPEIFQQDHGGQKIIPSFQVAFDYFQIKILKTNYDIQEAEKLIKLFKICVKKQSFHLLFEKKGLLRFLFNAYIYTQRSYQQILQLLIYLSKTLQKSPKKERIQIFSHYLNSFFWCKCQNCFPRYPQKWNPQQFVEFLYQTISQVKCTQNPYMALVYYFVMTNRKLRKQVSKKFVKFVLRSIPYVSKEAQEIIKTKIYFYVYAAFILHERNQYLNSKGIQSIQRVKNFPLSQKNLSIHRRFLCSYTRMKKNQEGKIDTIDSTIQKILLREEYFQKSRLPKRIKQAYTKKLRRFFQVKQNYKHYDQMKQFIKPKLTFDDLRDT